MKKIQLFWIMTLCAFTVMNSAELNAQSCTPSTTAVTCGTTTTFNLGASGYAGDNPTAGDGGCNPCCYSGADLDCDGLQDVPFSVENAKFYRYCNNTGSSQVVSINADEPGTGSTCNLQGAVWTGSALNSTTMDCGNTGYSNFDSNSGGAADGFTFGSVTVADGECAYIMVDGYAGATCTGVGLTVTCPCTPPIGSATGQTICSGTASSVALNSNIAGTTFTWTVNQSGVSGASNGSGSTIAQTLTATGTTAGTATYTVTPTAAGCPGTPFTVVVTVNPRPTMTSASTATICSGGTVSIPLTATVASTFVWSAAANANVTGESTTNQTSTTLSNTLTNSTTSVQTVTYTVTPTSTTGSCAGTAQTVTVTVNPVPTMTSANTATVCSGTALSLGLTSNVASTYTWVAGDNANTTGESLTNQTGNTINNTITNNTTVAQTVSYTVTPTSSAGNCPGTPQTVTVTVNPAPTMTSASTATICSGGTLSIGLTATMASTFTWIAANNANTSGESTTTQTTNTINNTITNTSASAQNVVYTVTPTSNPGGCPGPAQTVTVTVNPVPAMTSASTATICSGGTVSIPLTANVASSFVWVATANGNVTGESTTNQTSATLSNTLTNTTGAVQTVTYTVTPTSTVGNCPGTPQTVTVTVNPAPTMTSANTATVCSGVALNLGLTSDIASTYSWIAANNANTTGESTTTQTGATINNTITSSSSAAETVTYTVTPTSTAGNCPGAPQTVTVTVNPAPSMTSATTATICSGGTLSIGLTSNISSTYSWIAANNANTTGESTTAQTTSTINNTLTNITTSAQNVVYTVTPASNPGGCLGSPQTVTVTVNPVPAMTSASTATICSGGTVSIPLTANVASSFVWVATANGNVTGESTTNQTSGTLSNTLTNSTNAAQTVTYTVTPTSTVGNCPGTPQTVTVTVNPLPTMTSGNSATICSGSSVTIALSSDIASTYTWIAADNANTTGESTTLQTSATLSNTITNNTGVSQNVVYTVTPTSVSGSCAGNAQTVTVTVTPAPVATFSYTATPYCQNSADPSPVFSGGGTAGTFSSTAGLTINPGTGLVDLSASTAGTYTVTNTIAAAGGCPAVSATSSITITPLPVATFSYTGTPYCQNAVDPSPVFSGGGTAGAFTSAAGLVINASTGAIDLSTSTAGTYTVTNTIAAANGCPSVTATSNIVINAVDDPSFNYTPSTFCTSGSNPSAAITGTTGGTFSAGAGLTFVNTSTGEINLTASTVGTYTITYTTSGVCPSSSTANVTLTNAPGAAFSYAGPYCSSAANPTPTFGAGSSGGVFSSTAGLTINSSTGEIDLSSSTPGTYTVTNSIAASGACPAVNETASVTIEAEQVATFSYTGTPYCQSSVDPSPVFSGGGTAGVFSSTAGLVFTNTSTGEIDLSASTPGTYTVTNTIAAASSCPQVTSTATITITPLPVGTFSYAGTPYCQNAVNPSPTFSGGGVAGAFSSGTGLVINAGSGLVDLASSTPGTYTVTNTIAAANGCPAVIETSQLIINAVDNPAFAYSPTTFCITGTNPTPSITGTTGGTFTSVAGLILNAATGEIDLASSTTGTYSVTYTTSGACPSSSSMNVTLTTAPSGAFSYSGPYCTSSADPTPVFGAGSSAGTFSSTAGLVFTNSSTGEIDLSASSPGTYTVTNFIASSGGCAAVTETATITITQPSAGTFTFTGSPYCQGASDPLPVFIGGGVAGTFSAGAGLVINSGTGEIDLSATTPGSYTVTNSIAANGGCPAVTETFNITVNPEDDATFNYTASTYCMTGSNPTAVITGTTGGAFSSNPVTGVTINAATGEIDLASSLTGTFLVTYITTGACPDTSSMNITLTSAPDATFSYTGPYCTSLTGPVSPVFGTGASAGTVTSTSGLSINNITGDIDPSTSTAGTYIVTNTINLAGCAASADTALVIINPTPDVAAIPTTTICSGTTSNLVFTGNVAGTNFNFTSASSAVTLTGNSNGTGNVSDVLTNSGTSIDSVTYVVTPEANGCTGTPVSVVVKVEPEIILSTSPLSQSICSGASTNVTISSNVSGATYGWNENSASSTLAGAGPGSGTSIQQILTTTATSTDSATYIITSSINGCPGPSDTATVYVNPLPDVSAVVASDSICSGVSASVALSGTVVNTTYSWTSSVSSGTVSGNTSTSGTSITDILSNTGTDTEMVTYTITPMANGCTGSSVNAVVGVYPEVSMTVTPLSQTICSGAASSVSISSTTSGASFNWTATGSTTLTGFSAGAGNTIADALLNSGNDQDTAVYVITPSANGCQGIAQSVSVIVNPVPTATVTPSTETICSGASSTISVASPSTGITYTWTQVSGTNITGANTGSGTQFSNTTLTNSGSTIDSVVYTIVPEVAGCIGQTVTATVIITPAPTVAASVANETFCSGSSTNVTLSGTPSSATFTWTASSGSASVSGHSGGSGSSIAQLLTNSGNTSETVTYTITPEANGCMGTPVTYTATVNPVPVLSATPSAPSICSGSATSITLSSTVSGTSFTWTINSPVTVTGGSSGSGSQINQILTSTSSNPEVVSYQVTGDASGCQSTFNVNVTVTPQLAAPAVSNSAAYCQGAAIQPLTATGVTGATITWYSDAALTMVAGTGSPFTPTVSSTTTYYPVQSSGGCTSSAAPVTVTIMTTPVAQISATPLTGIAPLNVQFSNTTGGATDYLWNFGNGDSSVAATPSVMYNEAGTYQVLLTATNGQCTDTATIEIIVEGQSLVVVPNVFSPNNDGRNDVFLIRNESLSEFSLKIFDRWGLLLFETEDAGSGWNGTTRSGSTAPEGTYYFILVASGKDQKKYEQTGHLFLTR